MLRFVTTADTEILATAAAVEQLPADFPQVRCANPFGQDATQLVDTIMDGAGVVLVRVLGGRRGWQDGLPLLVERCREAGVPLLALGGEAEPDAEMTALSSAPSGAVGQAGEYLRHGDVDNVEQLLRFLADTFLLTGFGFEPPHETPDLGVYVPGRGDVSVEEAVAGHAGDKPTVGICFYRSHRLTGNTAFVDELVAQIEAAGANALAVWSYTLRRDDAGEVAALSLLDGRVDALVTTMLATGGSNAGDAARTGGRGRVRRRRRAVAGVGRARARGARRAGDPGGHRDRLARRLGGVGHRPLAARLGHPGRDPRVRRPPARRRDLVQGARRRGRLAGRRRGAALRRRPGALRARRAARRQTRAAALPAGERAQGRAAADGVPDQAREGRHGGRAGHPGERRRADRAAADAKG